ncbi:hypothetical protein BKA70DRAFT_378576 [Coprinopsis sp. MPI-PUGE-AT-0042]|nr:hypothetical protein BKA70DRAFT_378576 [Coprinopsis sp. MPI-PUGE-AT-0042]
MSFDAANITDFLPKFRTWTSHSLQERNIIAAAATDAEKRLQELQRLVLWQQSACAPIRSLPLELLTRILWLAIPSVSLHYDAALAPWNIGAVCKHWRNVLYSTPGIWNHITVDAKKLFPQDHSARLSHFLSLSRPRLLYVDFGTSNGFFFEQPGKPLIKILASEHLRWAGPISGPFLCACSRFNPTLDVIQNDTFPEVTSIEDGLIKDGELVDKHYPFVWFNRLFKFPKLRRLALSGLPGDLTRPGPTECQQQIQNVLADSVQWRLLSTLELNDPEHTFATVRVLSWPHINNLASLHHLILRGGTGPFVSSILRHLPPWHESRKPITLRHIRKLSLHGYPVHLMVYLSLLITPSLVDLELDAEQEPWQELKRLTGGGVVSREIWSEVDSGEIRSCLRILLKRSHCRENIHSLSLRGTRGDDLWPVVKAMPNIRKLLMEPEGIWNIWDTLDVLDRDGDDDEDEAEEWLDDYDDHIPRFKPLLQLQQIRFVRPYSRPGTKSIRGYWNHQNILAGMSEFLCRRNPEARIRTLHFTDPEEWIVSVVL